MNNDDQQKQDEAIDVAKLQTERDEYLAGWKRAQADYQNLKKDTERERGEYVKFANERLVHDLLPAFDQFELALKHAPSLASVNEADRPFFEQWMNGLRAVGGSWQKIASDIGLERIATDGAFDPLLHDAAGEHAVEEKEAGTIIEEVRSGWRWHGKVIRPSRVIIAK